MAPYPCTLRSGLREATALLYHELCGGCTSVPRYWIICGIRGRYPITRSKKFLGSNLARRVWQHYWKPAILSKVRRCQNRSLMNLAWVATTSGFTERPCSGFLLISIGEL